MPLNHAEQTQSGVKAIQEYLDIREAEIVKKAMDPKVDDRDTQVLKGSHHELQRLRRFMNTPEKLEHKSRGYYADRKQRENE